MQVENNTIRTSNDFVSIDILSKVRFFINANRALRVLFLCFRNMYNALQNKLEKK